jgi:hypothetical protein
MRLLLRPLCWIGRHFYFEIRRLNRSSHLMGCRNCDRRWGMNTDARVLIDWCMELEDHHRAMGDLN